MTIAIGIILFISIGGILLKYYMKNKYAGFLKYYDGIQENTVKEANAALNMLLLEFSDAPTEELGRRIYDLFSQNNTYIILTFLDNNDPNDNRTFELTNSINFRKIKNDGIAAFTDFDMMRNYVKNYISTEIILIADFIKLCSDHRIKDIILNPTLPNPFILSAPSLS